uniref:Uncharacterized protein n=1 Tax=Pararge aegeria TaxID=116150 RepID=S4PEG9_9NEOP
MLWQYKKNPLQFSLCRAWCGSCMPLIILPPLLSFSPTLNKQSSRLLFSHSHKQSNSRSFCSYSLTLSRTCGTMLQLKSTFSTHVER